MLDTAIPNKLSIDNLVWLSIYSGINLVFLVVSELKFIAWLFYPGVWSGGGAKVFYSHHIL